MYFQTKNNNFISPQQIQFNINTINTDIKKMNDNLLLQICNTQWNSNYNFTMYYYAIDELSNRYTEFKKQVENKRNNNNFIFIHPKKNNWKPNVNVSSFTPTFNPQPPKTPYPQLSSTTYKSPHNKNNNVYQLEKQMNNCFLNK